jgi:hypothetical protein
MDEKIQAVVLDLKQELASAVGPSRLFILECLDLAETSGNIFEMYEAVWEAQQHGASVRVSSSILMKMIIEEIETWR